MRLCNEGNFEKFLTFRKNLKANFRYLDYFVVDTLMKKCESSENGNIEEWENLKKLISYLTNGKTLEEVLFYNRCHHVKFMTFFCRHSRYFHDRLFETFSGNESKNEVISLRKLSWTRITKSNFENLPNCPFIIERKFFERVKNFFLINSWMLDYCKLICEKLALR